MLANADAEGFAGCISATVNLTAAASQAAWSGRGTPAGAAAAKKAAELRAIVARFPLVAAVKAALAARYDDPAWSRLCPPLMALDAGRAAELRSAFDERAARP